MASVNKVIIVGNLGSDPDVRTFDNGGKIATVSVATSDRWTDRNTGEPRESTEWHRIVFNNRLADVAQQYLRKGSQIYVEGSLHTRKWTDNQGIERYSTEIRASQMQMLGSRTDGQPQGQQSRPPQQPQGQQQPQWRDGFQPSPSTAMQRAPQGQQVSDNDIPF